MSFRNTETFKLHYYGVIYTSLLLLLCSNSSSGLECYRCTSGNGLEPYFPYHKNCDAGKLPKEFVETCGRGKVMFGSDGKYLNASDGGTLSNYDSEGTVCIKIREKGVVRRSCTNGYGTGYSCFYPIGSQELSCICHDNKCNGVMTLLPSFVACLVFVVSTVFHL